MVKNYGKVYTLGHPALLREGKIMDGCVFIEEKVDGSMWRCGVFDGQLIMASRNRVVNDENMPNMFEKAAEITRGFASKLSEGWTYFFEYMREEKHNTLEYDSVPKNHLMLFDIEKGNGVYADVDEKRDIANFLGVDCAPMLWHGHNPSAELIDTLSHKTSYLGGPHREGVVVKNYDRWGADGKFLRGKYVREEFKEIHGKDWKVRNPSQTDLVQKWCDSIQTDALRHKAVQRLKERGELSDTERDIGLIVKEVQKDIYAEVKEPLLEELWKKRIKKRVLKAAGGGVAEWYKKILLERQCEQ